MLSLHCKDRKFSSGFDFIPYMAPTKASSMLYECWNSEAGNQFVRHQSLAVSNEGLPTGTDIQRPVLSSEKDESHLLKFFQIIIQLFRLKLSITCINLLYTINP